MDDVSVLDGGELGRQSADGGDVEFVLVGFEIAELRKLLAAVIETTEVRLGLIVDDLVGADVPALRESLPTDLAMVWTFSSVPSFVRLQISKLGEAATTSRFFAWVWLDSGMGSLMNIEMRLLIETLGAILDCTLIPFLATLRARFFHRSTLICR